MYEDDEEPLSLLEWVGVVVSEICAFALAVGIIIMFID
jgi:hypothetical protein